MAAGALFCAPWLWFIGMHGLVLFYFAAVAFAIFGAVTLLACAAARFGRYPWVPVAVAVLSIAVFGLVIAMGFVGFDKEIFGYIIVIGGGAGVVLYLNWRAIKGLHKHAT